jgi:hypothetical protein
LFSFFAGSSPRRLASELGSSFYIYFLAHYFVKNNKQKSQSFVPQKPQNRIGSTNFAEFTDDEPAFGPLRWFAARHSDVPRQAIGNTPVASVCKRSSRNHWVLNLNRSETNKGTLTASESMALPELWGLVGGLSQVCSERPLSIRDEAAAGHLRGPISSVSSATEARL